MFNYLSPESVECLVQAEHPAPLPDVGGPPLRGRGDPPPLLALLGVVQLGPASGMVRG